MGRRGWVSVEDPSGDRWRLAVFDDGWVELPGFPEEASGTRAHLRTLLVLVGGFGVLVILSQLAGRLDGVGAALSLVLSVSALGLVLLSAVLFARLRARDRAQPRADLHRARSIRDDGHRGWPRLAGPALRRAVSSAEFVARVEAGVRIDAHQVGAIDLVAPVVPSPADPVVVSVLLHDGSVRTYRTPDRAAVELFAPWTRGPAGSGGSVPAQG